MLLPAHPSMARRRRELLGRVCGCSNSLARAPQFGNRMPTLRWQKRSPGPSGAGWRRPCGDLGRSGGGRLPLFRQGRDVCPGPRRGGAGGARRVLASWAFGAATCPLHVLGLAATRAGREERCLPCRLLGAGALRATGAVLDLVDLSALCATVTRQSTFARIWRRPSELRASG